MMTGEQYKMSLRDGRRIYQDGKLVVDLDTDPLLAPALESVAAGYDEYYRPDADAVNPLVEAPRTITELRDRVPILTDMDLLLNVTYQSLMTLVVAAARLSDEHPEFVSRINAYVETSRRADIRIAECITDAKGDRSKPPAAQDDPDQYVRVVERRPDGVVIRGAKLHITAAPLAHHLMVMPTKSMKPGEEDYAIACAVPVNDPGVHVVSRTVAARGGDERDYPVSSRRSMPDGFVIFDDVFVPHRHVFLDGIAARAGVFAHSLGLWERLGGTAVMVDQADEMVGLAQLIAEANGTARISHVREKIDEMMIHATMLRAGMDAAISNAHTTPEGLLLPRRSVHQRHEIPWRGELQPDGPAPARHRGRRRDHHAVDGRPGQPGHRRAAAQVPHRDDGGGRRDAGQAVPRHPGQHRRLLRRLASGHQRAIRRRIVRATAGHPQALRHGPRPAAGPPRGRIGRRHGMTLV